MSKFDEPWLYEDDSWQADQDAIDNGECCEECGQLGCICHVNRPNTTTL